MCGRRRPDVSPTDRLAAAAAAFEAARPGRLQWAAAGFAAQGGLHMQIGYFTERPYRWLDEDDVLRHKAFFALPNDRFDHLRAADDYNHWLDEYQAAEE